MSAPSGREPPSNGRIDLDTVSPTDLVLGAIHGFTEHQADTILASPDLLQQLNRLWNAAPPTSIITALAAEPTADGAAQRRLLDAAYAGPRADREPPAGAGLTAVPPRPTTSMRSSATMPPLSQPAGKEIRPGSAPRLRCRSPTAWRDPSTRSPAPGVGPAGIGGRGDHAPLAGVPGRGGRLRAGRRGGGRHHRLPDGLPARHHHRPSGFGQDVRRGRVRPGRGRRPGHGTHRRPLDRLRGGRHPQRLRRRREPGGLPAQRTRRTPDGVPGGRPQRQHGRGRHGHRRSVGGRRADLPDLDRASRSTRRPSTSPTYASPSRTRCVSA